MTVILMAIVGIVVGFALDELIARLAREYLLRDADVESASDPEPVASPARSIAPLDLGSETGAVALPRSLTTARYARTLLVVVATAAVFAMVGRQYEGHVGQIIIVAAYAAALIACAATDIIAFRVPNVISYPAILGALVVGMAMPGSDRVDVALGALLAGGLFLAMALLPGAPMGMGDVKLALFMGLALGVVFVVQAMLIMALTGGVVAAALLVLKYVGGRKMTYMFYAPFISLGGLYVLLFQGTVFHAL